MTAEPDSTTYRLQPAQYREILEEGILPYGLGNARPQDAPALLLVSGQLGARKSALKSRLTLYPRWDDAVEFGSDALRMYHPEHERLLRTDADTAWFYTDADARAWVEAALDHCLEQRFSVAYDSTLTHPATVEAMVRRFRAAGYRIEAAFAATPEAVSKLALVSHFLASVQHRGTGRFSLNHDETYRSVLDVADWTDRTKPFDQVSVYNRCGGALYRFEAAPHQGWVPANVSGTIKAERSRQWTEPESNQFLTSTRIAFRKANTIRMRGRPLGPIWFTRIADAVDLARPLTTGPAYQLLADILLDLHQAARARATRPDLIPSRPPQTPSPDQHTPAPTTPEPTR
jgi:hypothetical protein